MVNFGEGLVASGVYNFIRFAIHNNLRLETL